MFLKKIVFKVFFLINRIFFVFFKKKNYYKKLSKKDLQKDF